MCGRFGGGSFMLVYVLCLLLAGPADVAMEFSIGRAAQTSPLHMFQRLERHRRQNGRLGAMSPSGQHRPHGLLTAWSRLGYIY
jgi:NSS family neurotransmitter:Na+ symporter